uniref:Outer dynein arm docking complex subunit 1 n=1 Tax=Hippocampus comes TaxID=109280 RepID=A0A3Q2Z859_HIPCM
MCAETCVSFFSTELEKSKLLRHYRILDADRQAYSIQARQQEIEKLTAEQEELRHKLGAYKSLSRQKKDKRDAESLQVLLEQRDLLEGELEKEMQHQKELQKEALTRFNEQLTKNSHLREELQTLHIERVRFQRLQDRLIQELQDVRKKTGQAINLSTAAHDARVEAQSKLAMMREKAEKELAQYNTEMRELERVISHESGLRDFITTKYNEKMGQDVTEQVLGLQEQGTKDLSEESPDDLEAFFQRIQSVTGEADPELLVSSFIQGEDRNFALFNFVNEQNNEAEVLRDQISQIQREMEQFQMRGLRQEQDHHASLRDIDARQKDAESQTEDFENRAAVLKSCLILTGVSCIVSKVECDMEDSISDTNIMPYLGLVEQKTNQLLTIQAFLDNKVTRMCESVKLMCVKEPYFVIQTAHVDCDPDDLLVADEEERPLSQGELRRRILEGVSQIFFFKPFFFF